MAVDLGDLIDNLKREVNPPGANVFPDATDDSYFGYLQDAFWEARLDGVTILAGFNQVDGVISPVAVAGADITGDLQQLLVMYAGIRIIRNQILNTADTEAKAGPVEFKQSNSASMLVAILAELKTRRNIILTRLSDLGAIPSYYVDSIAGREESIAVGDTFYPSAGYSRGSYGDFGNYGGGW